MNKYRRVEVNAFNRRLTIFSGEWPRDFSRLQPSRIEDEVSLDGKNLCEAVEPDSPEGQMILVEAVRSLERRLSPEARATIRDNQDTDAKHSNLTAVSLRLQSLYQISARCIHKYLKESRNEDV
jgi:hypothetical protein